MSIKMENSWPSPRNGSVPENGPVELKKNIVQTLLFRALLGQLQDLSAAAEEFAGIAGGRRRLHFVASQNPNFHSRFVQRFNGVRRLLLEPAHR